MAALHQKDLQLLRDVETRWSSTVLMIERAIILRHVSVSFEFRTESDSSLLGHQNFFYEQ